jgi:hypothetical protein
MEFMYSLPLLQIHIGAVFATLAIVIISDFHGLLWVLGKSETLPYARMRMLHTCAWIGLITIILAGATMFSSYPQYLLSLPAFQLKMVFVAFLLMNAFVIGKHMHVAVLQPFATLSKQEKLVLLISGAVSTIGWIGAYVCAQFLS